VHIRSGVQEFAGRREGSYLGASPEVRYILEAVSKPRPARLPPAFLIAPGPASQRPTLLLHLSLSLSLSLSPSSSGTGVRPGARGRDAARGTALNLIWGGLRVRRKVRTHLLTVRSGGGLASPSNWVPVSHALSVRHPLPSPPPLSLSLSLSLRAFLPSRTARSISSGGPFSLLSTGSSGGGPRRIREYARTDLFAVGRRCRRKCFMRDNVCAAFVSFCFLLLLLPPPPLIPLLPLAVTDLLVVSRALSTDARNEIERKFLDYRNGCRMNPAVSLSVSLLGN